METGFRADALKEDADPGASDTAIDCASDTEPCFDEARREVALDTIPGGSDSVETPRETRTRLQ